MLSKSCSNSSSDELLNLSKSNCFSFFAESIINQDKLFSNFYLAKNIETIKSIKNVNIEVRKFVVELTHLSKQSHEVRSIYANVYLKCKTFNY